MNEWAEPETGERPALSETEKDLLIRQGLADVDAGRTLPQAEMLRWAATLRQS